ncbi:MAG: NAD(P)/FAD-dependent oxidoreductase [Lachnospiraceae bacterium]|nr:NAD(P)/FAD-dependent oxidoreductase [Lachnospiraceae bacterium]
MDRKKKAVIIGGGIAGLTAGIYALTAGFDAEIYEKNSVPGGQCMGWNRKGYHIDNCIHWLTGTRKGTELYQLWKTVGALSNDTEYAKIDSFYTSVHNGKSVTLWSDLKKTEKELIEAAPEDEAEIRKFIQHVEYAKQCHFPAGKPMEMWGVRDYIAIGKEMADFPKVMKEFGKISLEEYSRHFKSPIMQKVITDYLPKAYTAYCFLVSYATMADGNGNIPMGASLQMALRMEKRFKELGGKIYYNSPAAKIELDQKTATGIRLESGEVVSADYVIPAIDTYPLFHILLPEKYMPKELEKAYKSPKAYPAISGFQTAFTVSKDFDHGETVFIDIDPIKVGIGTYDRMYVKAYGYDPLFVKDGKQVIQTCISQFDNDFEWWKNLSKEEYGRVKQELTDAVVKRIQKAFPETEGDLEHLDTWTPLTYERYCNAYHGSYMSFITTPMAKQSALKGKVKHINNLYLAGQWTNSPGGLPVAAASGKFAVQRILKRARRNTEI